MASKKMFFLFSILLSMVGTKAGAQYIAVKNTDDVTIYYHFINDGTELEVTCYSETENGLLVRNLYSGDVNIPSVVKYMDKSLMVTRIGESAFDGCFSLNSVTIPYGVTTIEKKSFSHCNLHSIKIPSSVTTIGEYAFKGNDNLTSITIPSSVTSIGMAAFDCINLTEVVSKIEDPFDDNHIFMNNTYYNATLYVPVGTINKYKDATGWRNFINIEEGSGSIQECKMPTISYQNGKLEFHCDTEDVTYHYSINDYDVQIGIGQEVQLGLTYYISVYATKDGYWDSETAVAVLCWIDANSNPGNVFVSGTVQISTHPVLIQTNGNVMNIIGAPEGSDISVYNLSGQMVGAARAVSASTNISTSLQPGDVGIIKIGKKAVKVVVK